MAINLLAFCTGDTSVGIPNVSWSIEDVGSLDDYPGQREDTRKLFEIAFLTIADNIKIVFSDEIAGGD